MPYCTLDEAWGTNFNPNNSPNKKKISNTKPIIPDLYSLFETPEEYEENQQRMIMERPENQQIENIIPAFAYYILKLEIAVRDKLLEGKDAEDMERGEIQPKFETNEVFEKLKLKVQSDIDGGGKPAMDIQEELFQKIIDQADGLDDNPFGGTFTFKI